MYSVVVVAVLPEERRPPVRRPVIAGSDLLSALYRPVSARVRPVTRRIGWIAVAACECPAIRVAQAASLVIAAPTAILGSAADLIAELGGLCGRLVGAVLTCEQHNDQQGSDTTNRNHRSLHPWRVRLSVAIVAWIAIIDTQFVAAMSPPDVEAFALVQIVLLAEVVFAETAEANGVYSEIIHAIE